MSNFRTFSLAVLMASLAWGGSAAAVTATTQRTFVASTGVDTNPCSRAAPCRTFGAAEALTSDSGEVIVLDSAGYGPVTITKSIAIEAPTGVYAGISVFSGDGITIATPGISVILRGLTINGQGGAGGIVMTAGSALTVENCVITNLTSDGVQVGGQAQVRIADSRIQSNSGSGLRFIDAGSGVVTRSVIDSNYSGITVNTTGSNATTINISNVDVVRNDYEGVYFASGATGAISASIRDSQVSGSSYGVDVESSGGALVVASVSGSVISNNDNAFWMAGANAKVWASGNTITENFMAVHSASGAVFESAGNNAVRNNTAANVGTVTVVSPQ